MTPPSMHSLVAVVTGSSRGIGRAIALALGRAGADVVVNCVHRMREAEAVADEIRSIGRRALVVQADVSERAQVRHLAAKVVGELGRVDAWVNNAGLLQTKSFSQITDDDWDRVHAVNLKSVFLCAQEIFPVMEKQPTGGAMVNLASSGGQLGGTRAVHYATSKAGLIGLTKSLARVGAPRIRVNAIAPGLIETEMTADERASPDGATKVAQIPLGRVGSADEVAAAAVMLASPQGAYITGQVLNVNGGLYLG